MKKLVAAIGNLGEKFQSLCLLGLRLTLAYGFYNPALSKLQNIDSVAKWFEQLGYPSPLLSAYLAGITELLGVFLLPIGLFTRLISLPLMFVMIVAIFTVHWEHGFPASQNGFEIPLYYFLMLFILFSHGAGKLSLDYLIFKKP